MPIYPHKCACGHREDMVLSFAMADMGAPCKKCGRKMSREFTTQVGFYVPPYMRAPGAAGSSDAAVSKQAVYLQSDKHREDMKDAEKGQERLRRAKYAKEDLNRRIEKNLEKARQQT